MSPLHPPIRPPLGERRMTTVSMASMTALVERVPNGTALSPSGLTPSHEDTAATFTIGTILSIMCLVGVTGNIYTLVVMCQSMRTSASMYIYIINLAMADLLYLLTIPFVVCTHFLQGWHFGDVGCRILISIDFLTMHASIFTLTIMSTERYFAVLKPLDTVKRSKSYRKAIALLVWAASLVLTLPMMVMIRQRQGSKVNAAGAVKRICFPTWTPEAFKAYLTVMFLTSVLVPGLLMVALYAGLARHYWAAQASLGGCGSSSSSSSSRGRSARRRGLKQKVASMIFSIVVAYWACFLPFWVWQLTKLFSPESLRPLSAATHNYVNFSVTCLTYGNSCVNPLLYTLLTRNYKDYLAQKGQTMASSRAEGGSAVSGPCIALRGASCG